MRGGGGSKKNDGSCSDGYAVGDTRLKLYFMIENRPDATNS